MLVTYTNTHTHTHTHTHTRAHTKASKDENVFITYATCCP